LLALALPAVLPAISLHRGRPTGLGLRSSPEPREAGSAPASTPLFSGKEITIRGPYLCLVSHLRQGERHISVVYAFDGSEEVRATVQDVLNHYPPQAMDVAAARRFQQLLDREVLYYVEPNAVEQKVHGESEWWGWPAEVTGTVVLRDGKRWIIPTSVSPNITLQPPPEFTRPDRPQVMPKLPPFELNISDTLSIRCLPIPAGSFVCGSPFWQWPRCHDEYPHEVVLTKDFYLSETPITQEVFEAVMGRNPTPEPRRGPRNPVEDALWDDLQEFCHRVSQQSGRRVRLPTASEFEYAARVGTSDACFAAKYREQESNIGNKGAAAAPVKTKQPSAWGLYDMYTFYGWHACRDFYDMHKPGKLVDPQGPPFSPMRKGRHIALGGDQYGARPNILYWYDEGPNPCDFDGHWVGIFRIAVEVGSRSAAPDPAARGAH